METSALFQNNKGNGKGYDAMVIYGEEIEYATFAEHLIHRLETIEGLNVFVPKRDLEPYDFIRRHEVTDIIASGRCNKVISILSPSLFNDPLNKFISDRAMELSAQNPIVVPVIYGNQDMDDIHHSIQGLAELKFDPEKTYDTKFWENLMKSLDFEVHSSPELEPSSSRKSSSSSATSKVSSKKPSFSKRLSHSSLYRQLKSSDSKCFCKCHKDVMHITTCACSQDMIVWAPTRAPTMY